MSISSLPLDQQLHVLDTLLEPSPELHTVMTPFLSSQSFSSIPALIDAVQDRLRALSTAHSPTDQQILVKILGSHPRLGRAPTTPATTAEPMSELSKKEQAQLNTPGEDQAERLALLNEEYERRFPGLRFVYVSEYSSTKYSYLLDQLVERLSMAGIAR